MPTIEECRAAALHLDGLLTEASRAVTTAAEWDALKRASEGLAEVYRGLEAADHAQALAQHAEEG